MEYRHPIVSCHDGTKYHDNINFLAQKMAVVETKLEGGTGPSWEPLFPIASVFLRI